MNPKKKIYSTDKSTYQQKSVSKRIEALFLNNVGLVVTREQIKAAARNPINGSDPENWHQRLSELRTDKGYTILSNRDWAKLAPQEYCMPHTKIRAKAAKRVVPSKNCWKQILATANDACQWRADGQLCGLKNGAIDPIGGGTVKLTPDHLTPHSINPKSDPDDAGHWQALCGRHQVMKKNFWDSSSGKFNLLAILQASSRASKREAYEFLRQYFSKE